MKLHKECVECILGQAKRVASVINASDDLSRAIEQTSQKLSQNFSFDATPPEVATPMYEALALLAQTDDLYKEAKAHASQTALELVPQLQQLIDTSEEPLLTAGKMAVVGNVIDLATPHEYDLHEEVAKVLDTAFAVDAWADLFESLQQTQRLLYLADNAGEHIFDKLFIQTIKQRYPEMQIFYVTRDCAIINDVTMGEAQDAGLDEVATLISSGVRTPGFVYQNASQTAQDLFDNCDTVIAKGMGNYETLTEIDRRTVFHLFKVKCSVVSQSVGEEIGSLMCMKR